MPVPVQRCERARCATRSPGWRRAPRCATASTASCGPRRAPCSCSSDDADVLVDLLGRLPASTPRTARSGCRSWRRWTAPSSSPPTAAASPAPTSTSCPTRPCPPARPAPATAPPNASPARSTCRSCRRSEEMGVINVYAGGDQAPAAGDRPPARPGQPGAADARALQGRASTTRSPTSRPLEIEDVVTLRDVVAVVQRGEMVHRIADEIETMIIELGVDARLLRLQLDELYGEIDDELDLVVADYLPPGRNVADDARRDVAALRRRRARPAHSPPPRCHPAAIRPTSARRSRRRGCDCSTACSRLPPETATAIANHFGGLAKLQRVTVDDLMAVDGVDEATARAIEGHPRAASPSRRSSTSTAELDRAHLPSRNRR